MTSPIGCMVARRAFDYHVFAMPETLPAFPLPDASGLRR